MDLPTIDAVHAHVKQQLRQTPAECHVLKDRFGHWLRTGNKTMESHETSPAWDDTLHADTSTYRVVCEDQMT